MLGWFCLIVGASFSGVFCGDLLCRSKTFRDITGRLFGHGPLIAIVDGKGIYEKDVGEFCSLSDLVVMENLSRLAREEFLDKAKVEGELALLQAEFGDEKDFLREVRSNLSSLSWLREKVADQIRSLQWLERQINSEAPVTEEKCRDFYETHRQHFAQPIRFRASHIFLAAPVDSPPEVVESKRGMIDALAKRLEDGESFSQLAAEASEDEATKGSGGDLGFFSSERMPPEFFAQVQRLAVGQRSNPFRSHLGFHIVALTEMRAGQPLSLADAQGEILLALTNERRVLLTERLTGMLNKPMRDRFD